MECGCPATHAASALLPSASYHLPACNPLNFKCVTSRSKRRERSDLGREKSEEGDIQWCRRCDMRRSRVGTERFMAGVRGWKNRGLLRRPAEDASAGVASCSRQSVDVWQPGGRQAADPSGWARDRPGLGHKAGLQVSTRPGLGLRAGRRSPSAPAPPPPPAAAPQGPGSQTAA